MQLVLPISSQQPLPRRFLQAGFQDSKMQSRRCVEDGGVPGATGGTARRSPRSRRQGGPTLLSFDAQGRYIVWVSTFISQPCNRATLRTVICGFFTIQTRITAVPRRAQSHRCPSQPPRFLFRVLVTGVTCCSSATPFVSRQIQCPQLSSFGIT